MKKSKVYFTNLRTRSGDNLLDKLERLVKTAGIETIDFQDKYVAIKIHFGEPGNLAYLRPNYSKRLVDIIKRNGGKAFLGDCNTLYVGRRKNALDHLEAAYENGYNPFTTGCPIIIADGIKGLSEQLVPINAKHVKEAKIGTAFMEADIIISLNHFKGHGATGFGGALKNVGMGCGSRAGKMEMHSSGIPFIKEDLCVSCDACFKSCAHDAIFYNQNHKAEINSDLCVGCGRCIGSCNVNAVKFSWDEANEILNEKIAEYSLAVLQNRPHFHINLVIDVSPDCDCHGHNDLAIVGNIGMFASFDPVALDVACADAVNSAPVVIGSSLETIKNCHDDHFTNHHPETNWKAAIRHAEVLGLGVSQYELEEVK